VEQQDFRQRVWQISRRDFCRVAGGSLAALATASACGCTLAGAVGGGRFSARPRGNVKTTVSGQLNLNLSADHEAILQVPKNAAEAPLPLLLMLHGATQNPDRMFRYFGNAPDEAGVVVLAPKSRDTTWDAIGGDFGEDFAYMNRALERTFELVAIDPARMAIGGFSDGASYGLSLGLMNGDLFSRVAAFSPGFLIDGTPHGKPRIFISHGTHDHILPIERCGRRLAKGLVANGYDVTFREFDGDHEIPEPVALEAMKWIAGSGS
jgi:phospholipase/carboxylesterase